MLLDIVKYFQILQNIAQYCAILYKIVKYCLLFLNILQMAISALSFLSWFLIITCYPSLATCYLPLAIWQLLLATRYFPLVTWQMLLVTCYLLHVTCCMLLIVIWYLQSDFSIWSWVIWSLLFLAKKLLPFAPVVRLALVIMTPPHNYLPPFYWFLKKKCIVENSTFFISSLSTHTLNINHVWMLPCGEKLGVIVVGGAWIYISGQLWRFRPSW